MRRTFAKLAVFAVVAVLPLWADEVATSTTVPSVAITGETKSAPAPQAMTDRVGGPVVGTLTRSALSSDELPSSFQVVRPDDYLAFGALNAGEALAHQAGLQTLPIGELGSPISARIRGSTPNQTLILIDGRPMAGAALGSQDLTEIPVEQIDHIEILRGGASALYGPNAMGGVINVITKRATYNGIPLSHVGYETASYGHQTYRLDYGSRLGPVDYFFFGNRAWESGFRHNSDASTYNIGGNAGLSMGQAGKLIFDAATFSNNAGVPGQLVPPVPTNQFDNEVEKVAPTPNARTETTSQYVRSSYLLPLPMDSLMTLRLHDSARDLTTVDPDIAVNTERHETSKGGEIQFQLPLGFLAGGSFVHDRLDLTDQIASTNTFIRSAEDWGFFLQDTLKAGPLTVIPSGRFDQATPGGDSTNPRVQAMLDALPWLRLSASGARSFRAPTLDELQLNPMLAPERGWTYDAGFEVHPTSFSLRATYFRANVSDLIESSSGTTATAANIGTARRQGAEIEITHILNEYFRDTWNYTYLENRGIPQGMGEYVTLAHSPRHTANVIATVTPFARWRFDATGRYVSSRFSDLNDPIGSNEGSMVLVDLRLAYQWRQMEVYLGVDDVTDRRYEEISGYPLPGRTAYLGVSLRLWG